MPRLQRIVLWMLQPKVGLPLALLLCLAGSPFVYRATRLAGLPDCGPPFDVEAFGTQEVPDAENAFVEYRAAEKLYQRMPSSKADVESFDKALEEGWSEANANIRKWVADNRVGLEIWRRGTEKPDALNHQPKDLAYDTLLPPVQSAQSFARLAHLEALRLEAAGDLDAAWDWYHAMFRSSRHVGKRAVMMGRFVGRAIHTDTARAIAKWANHDELTPDQLRRAIAELQDAYAMTSPPSVAYKCEYHCFENNIKPSMLSEILDTTTARERLDLFLQNEPEMGRRVVRQAFANWLTQVDKPRHQRRSQVPGHLGLYERDPTVTYPPDSLPPEQVEEFARKSMIVGELLPAQSQFSIAVTREQARQNTLITILALRLHQLENGHLPDKLEELVDAEILESVPIDPWHPTGKPLLYRHKDNTATVYSLGENGVDDGGDLDTGDDVPADIGFAIEPGKTHDEP